MSRKTDVELAASILQRRKTCGPEMTGQGERRNFLRGKQRQRGVDGVKRDVYVINPETPGVLQKEFVRCGMKETPSPDVGEVDAGDRLRSRL